VKHGTLIVFNHTCKNKYEIEFPKKSNKIARRMELVFTQKMLTDFAKIGKTPSFGGINLITPTNLFQAMEDKNDAALMQTLNRNFSFGASGLT